MSQLHLPRHSLRMQQYLLHRDMATQIFWTKTRPLWHIIIKESICNPDIELLDASLLSILSAEGVYTRHLVYVIVYMPSSACADVAARQLLRDHYTTDSTTQAFHSN